MTIQDNGVGRKQAAKNKGGFGKGIKMTEEFYEIVNQTTEKDVSFSISNVEPTGTKVEARMPV